MPSEVYSVLSLFMLKILLMEIQSGEWSSVYFFFSSFSLIILRVSVCDSRRPKTANISPFQGCKVSLNQTDTHNTKHTACLNVHKESSNESAEVMRHCVVPEINMV